MFAIALHELQENCLLREGMGLAKSCGMIRLTSVASLAVVPLLAACASSASTAPPLDDVEDAAPARPSPAAKSERLEPAATPDAGGGDGGDGQSPQDAGCKLDTRTVYIQDGKKIESITANGRSFVRVLASDGSAEEGAGFPRETASDPKYADGPCAGRTSCSFDSRVVYFDGSTKVESLTARGWYYVYGFQPDGTPFASPGFPQPLTQTPAFAAGPCALAKGDACTFDTRTLEMRSGTKVETITAYGRWFEYVVTPDLARSPRAIGGAYLDDVPRLAGPCSGQPNHECTLDTRTVYLDLDGVRSEEITARGRLWVFRLAADDSLLATPVDGVPLSTVGRFVGPCKP